MNCNMKFLNLFEEFLSLFTYQFVWKALIAGILIGIMGAIIGVFILLRGLVFFGEAVAHSAFAGAGLALLLQINPLGLTILFSIGSAVGIQYINDKKIMRDEIILGIFFTATMALAIIFVNLATGYFAMTEITSIIFGNLLIIRTENFIAMIIICIISILILFVFKKELHSITFDAEMARVSGIPVKTVNYIFIILTSLVIAVSLKAIGAILVFALVITPAAAALQYTFKLDKMILLSIGFSIISTFFGIILSFLFDLATGATIVVIATIIFAISFIISPKRGRASEFPSECKFCKKYLTDEERAVCDRTTCGILEDHYHAIDRVKLIKDKEKEGANS
ncbi:MAG: hypothetical protein GF329_19390 [Candidatus Lokiarchaeota archaeon]|nr:hypothetical protein [Candidatus Lokiarchaeota archaeon]